MLNKRDSELPRLPSQEQADQLTSANGPHCADSCDHSDEEIPPYPLAAPAAAQIWPRVFPGL